MPPIRVSLLLSPAGKARSSRTLTRPMVAIILGAMRE